MSLAAIAGWGKKTLKKVIYGATTTAVGLSGMAVATSLFLTQPAYATGPSLASAPTPCATIGTSFLTVNQDIQNDPDSGNYGNWASDAFTLTANVWLGTDNTTYCATATVSNATFVTTGPLSPQAGQPLASGITGTFTGGETYTLPLTLNPAYSISSHSTLTLPDNTCASNSCANGAFSNWVGEVFTNAVAPYADYTETYALTYTTSNNGTWTDADPTSLGSYSAGDIGSIENTTTNTAYATIQDAVTNASTGNTIGIAAGTYSENVIINNPITLRGAQAGVNAVGRGTGNETIIDGSGGDGVAVNVNTSGVTLDGFTISGATSTGVFNNASNSNVTIENNIITGNSIGLYANCTANCLVQQNEFKDDNISGPAGGAGIYTDGGSHGLTINSNDFTGLQINSAIIFAATSATTNSNATVTNNTIENNNSDNSMIYVVGLNGGIFTGNTVSQDGTTALKFAGAVTNVTVSNNHLTDSGTGVKVADDGYGFGDNSNITINDNDLSGDIKGVANVSGYSGALDASSNWWGDALGPNTSNYSGDVTISPWCSASDCSTTQSASSGKTTLPVDQPADLGTPTAVGGQYQATLPDTNDVLLSNGTNTVTIPAGTTVTADSNMWNGTITPPTVQSNTSVTIPTPSGTTTTIATVIEVGSNGTSLTFSKAVELVFPNQAGELVGFVKNSVFTPITTNCSAYLPNLDTNMPVGGDCYTTSGSDLIVWTKHFTTFVTYSQVPTPSSSSNSSSNSSSPSSSNIAASGTNGQNSSVLGENSGGLVGSALSTTNMNNGQIKPVIGAANSIGKAASGLKWYWWAAIIIAVLVITTITMLYRMADR